MTRRDLFKLFAAAITTRLLPGSTKPARLLQASFAYEALRLLVHELRSVSSRAVVGQVPAHAIRRVGVDVEHLTYLTKGGGGPANFLPDAMHVLAGVIRKHARGRGIAILPLPVPPAFDGCVTVATDRATGICLRVANYDGLFRFDLSYVLDAAILS